MPLLNANNWVGVNAGTDLPQNNFQAQQYGGLNQIDFQNLIAQQLAQQQQAYGSENALAGQIQNGPDLARQLLEQQTQQGIQSQAGAVAGLRGLNPAQQARLIAMNGVSAQQQMVGQGATLEMQQELAKQQQLAALYGQQAGQNAAFAGMGVTGNQNQNATNLQNFSQAQSLNQQTAAQNAQLKSTAQGQNEQTTAADGLISSGINTIGGAVKVAAGLAHGGHVPAGRLLMVSPGEGVVKDGHETRVPGRANVPGDSTANDVVPLIAKSPLTVVPRGIEDDPVAKQAFLAAVKKHHAKHGAKKKAA